MQKHRPQFNETKHTVNMNESATPILVGRPDKIKPLSRRQFFVFLSRINFSGKIMPHTPELGNCWEWEENGLNNRGYGQFSVNHQNTTSHRLSYRIFCGPIGALDVCHKCDNPRCCNPNHLFLGTEKDNMADKIRKCRCAKGVFNGANTKPYMIPRGENHGASKLTECKVHKIRALLENGVVQEVIARQFGINQTAVGFIKRRKNWKHLPLWHYEI